MQNVAYLATTNAAGAVRILRTGEASPASGDAPTFPMEIPRPSPEGAQQLGWLLLYDSLGNDRRADRLQAPFTDLLIKPLLDHKQWVLTQEDIEAAVQSIELTEGWLWLDAGFYEDEDPLLGRIDAIDREEDDEPSLA